jgi:hypothetical protein
VATRPSAASLRRPRVDGTASAQRVELHLAVAAHAQQQRHRRLVGDQHLDRQLNRPPQPLVGAGTGRGLLGLVDDRREPVERLVERL